MTQLITRRLGRTGRQVTTLGLGGQASIQWTSAPLAEEAVFVVLESGFPAVALFPSSVAQRIISERDGAPVFGGHLGKPSIPVVVNLIYSGSAIDAPRTTTGVV